MKGKCVSGALSTTKAKCGLGVRSALSQATQHLATNLGLSPQEAREWTLQEVMAKRAGPLVEAAQAIVAGETVAYRYEAPV